MNRLNQEKSLYLRQHASNPVHWFAWGNDAFEKAEKENKPVLISIGYSTCHWCHVMEKESFETEEVAQVLNEHFIAIKVDREELPAVDSFYMESLLAFSGRGGWPLNMFALPNKKPFFGGTYFPKENFIGLLMQIRKVWDQHKDQIMEQANSILEHVGQGHVFDSVKTELPLHEIQNSWKNKWLPELAAHSLKQHDPVWGGFGSAPKFPRSHQYNALMRALDLISDASQKKSLEHCIEQSLKAMAYGGLRDHLRGGFHRYSTDQEWLAPHFEKMLYDQALLIQTYSESFKQNRNPMCLRIVEETSEFLEAEMRLPEGGWAAAQDADSEGVEGKYYIWSRAELAEHLSSKGFSSAEIESFFRIHNVSESGNWEGHNILSCSLSLSWSEWSAPRMTEARSHLLQLRKQRIAPLTDHKWIVSWNCWMATGLLRASLNTLDNLKVSEKLLLSAEKTINATLNLIGENFEIPHIVYAGKAKGAGYLEDYVSLVEALQFLAIRKPQEAQRLVQAAEKILALINARFRKDNGTLSPFQLHKQDEEVPFAKLEDQDGATPSAISVYIGALLRQAALASKPEFLSAALKELAPLRVILDRFPNALSHLLAELDALFTCTVKLPESELTAFWKELSSSKKLAGQIIPVIHDSNKVEVCDLNSCFSVEEHVSDLKKIF